MSPQQPSVKAIFDEAAEAAGAERSALLDRACADDAELRRRVEALLCAHDEAGSFLEKPAPAFAATGAFPAPPGRRDDPGTMVGPYRLLRPIGEGGMGVVWMAEQREPFERTVALKLIRPGLDLRQVLARFEAERQALALMDHPNIAKVLDADTAQDGRPYFVMELVKGESIVRYCDERRLTPRRRLGMFVDVCQAVQHAHQKGVIHRDIKPSNVMVGEYDGEAAPKVIDFGIAKAAGPRLTGRTLVTELGAVVGTLEYMSPEQAHLDNLDVDTRSDIYSLGVLLFELLTGTTPLESKRVKEVGLLEALRMIREDEAVRPSARLSTGEGLPGIAACRGVEPARLSGLLHGELDWIVMRCLDKDRARRYETAAALAADVQRYLRDEPVQAFPPSPWYRVGKFVRRNRVAVTAASLVLLALLGGIVGTSMGLLQARWAEAKALDEAGQKEAARGREEQQRRVAEAEAGRAGRAEQDAKSQAEIAREVNEFLDGLLRQADIGRQPWFFGLTGERDPDVTVRVVLDRSASRIEGRFTKQELTEAAIRRTMGEAYLALGEYPEAGKHLERSAALRTLKLGAGHLDTLQVKQSLGLLLYRQGKHGDAEALLLEVAEGFAAGLGAGHSDTLHARGYLAIVLAARDKLEQAEALIQGVLGRAPRSGQGRLLVLGCKNTLACIHGKQGRHGRAEALFREVLAGISGLVGPDHPAPLVVKGNVAWECHKQKDYRRAEALYKATIATQTAKLGKDHPDTLTTRQNLADMYTEQKKYGQAETILKEVLAARIARLPPNHPHTIATKNNLGLVYYRMERYRESIPLFEELLARQDEASPGAGDAAFNLAANYREVGRLKEALDLIDKWLPAARARAGVGHPKTRFGLEVARSLHGMAATPAGRAVSPAGAVAFLKELLKAETAELGEGHASTLLTTKELAALHWRLKQFTESVPLFERELRLRREAGCQDDTLIAAFNLAVNYGDAGRVKEAAKVIDDWLPRAQTRRGFDDPTMKFGVQAAHFVYRLAGTPDKAELLLRDQAAFWKEKTGGASGTYALHLGLLGLNLLERKKYAEAEPVLRECLGIRRKREPDLWTTFSIQSMLGEALLGQKKHSEAETMLLNGHEGLRRREAKIPPQGKFVLGEALERLVRLYDAWDGKQEAAARWRRELQAHKKE